MSAITVAASSTRVCVSATRSSIVPCVALRRRSHHCWPASGSAPPSRAQTENSASSRQLANAGGTPARGQLWFSFARTVASPESSPP